MPVSLPNFSFLSHLIDIVSIINPSAKDRGGITDHADKVQRCLTVSLIDASSTAIGPIAAQGNIGQLDRLRGVNIETTTLNPGGIPAHGRISQFNPASSYVDATPVTFGGIPANRYPVQNTITARFQQHAAAPFSGPVEAKGDLTNNDSAISRNSATHTGGIVVNE